MDRESRLYESRMSSLANITTRIILNSHYFFVVAERLWSEKVETEKGIFISTGLSNIGFEIMDRR